MKVLTSKTDAAALLEFPHSVTVDTRALGKSLPIRIGRRNGRIYLPKMEMLSDEGQVWVERPHHWSSTRWEEMFRSYDQMGFGFHLREPWGMGWVSNLKTREGEAHIFRSIISVSALRPTQTVALELSRSLTQSIEQWIRDLFDWIEVISKQDLNFEHPLDLYPGSRRILDSTWFFRRNGSVSHHIGDQPIVFRDAPGSPLSFRAWKAAIQFANSAQKVSTPLLILRDARGYLGRNDYRRSVIDSALVVETVLVPMFLERLRKSVNANFAQKSQKQFQTMGRYLPLLEAMGVALPADMTDKMVKVRNRAVHEGHVPSRSEAEAALEIAEKIALLHVDEMRMVTRLAT